MTAPGDTESSSVLMDLGEGASIQIWHDFLVEECGLQIGRDWQWGWRHNRWHVELFDPRHESLVRLRQRGGS